MFPLVLLLLCELLDVTVRVLLQAPKFPKVTPSQKMLQQMVRRLTGWEVSVGRED